MQAARGGAGRPGRPGRGPERERERPPGAGATSPCAAPGLPAGGATMHPGPPSAWPPRARAALRLWLGCVCFALVQAGKGARGGGPAGRRRGRLLYLGVPWSFPCPLGISCLRRNTAPLTQPPASPYLLDPQTCPSVS